MEELQLMNLTDIFDDCLSFWHGEPKDYKMVGTSLNPLALELSYKNYLLWHEEDKARRTDVADSEIAAVKRAIDKLNQQRNDLIERIDAEVAMAVEVAGARRSPGRRPAAPPGGARGRSGKRG